MIRKFIASLPLLCAQSPYHSNAATSAVDQPNLMLRSEQEMGTIPEPADQRRSRSTSAKHGQARAKSRWRSWPFWRELSLRVLAAMRKDPVAVLLVLANIAPVIDLVKSGEPVGSLLVIYWIQLMIIGLWNIPKIIIMARWFAIVLVPAFCAMYFGVLNIFGFIAGGLLDDQMRGTEWHENFALSNYTWLALLFFGVHGFSFVFHFLRGREWEGATQQDYERQISKPMIRVMPMWLAALFGGFVAAFFHSAAVVVLFVMPVKILLDVYGHLWEHQL
ncbi:MAG: hypothetical protein GY906_31385 [bacterium]|nr:hypothetical protein [bacterium]